MKKSVHFMNGIGHAVTVLAAAQRNLLICDEWEYDKCPKVQGEAAAKRGASY